MIKRKGYSNRNGEFSRNSFLADDGFARTNLDLSPPFEIAVNPRERSNDSKHRYSGKPPLKLRPGGKELSVFKRFHPIVHGYTRAYARASRYTEPRLRVRTGTCARRREEEEEEEEGFLAKFEARCASESVLRIPGQSSGCALTARNPAAFSPSPGVCRETATTRDDDPRFKELQWDCDGNPLD